MPKDLKHYCGHHYLHFLTCGCGATFGWQWRGAQSDSTTLWNFWMGN